MGNKRIKTTLLYSGTLHNDWTYSGFHSRCDGKLPTISLFQIKNGDCVGGFTKAPWSSHVEYNSDPYATVFNATRSRHFSSQNTGNDIWCDADFGPCFSGGGSDLAAHAAPFNAENKCWSWANKPGFKIPLDENGKNQLTN